MKSTVALISCSSYDPTTVSAAVCRGVDLLGGVAQFVSLGERLLFKPNILAGEAPSRAVTTHPVVLSECLKLFAKAGAECVFGDSPGLEGSRHAAEGSELMEAGLAAGGSYGDFRGVEMREYAPGQFESAFPLAKALAECDGVVNLPKAKTHQLTRITGAVKNLYGCIPGRRKAAYHIKYPDVIDFCHLLEELNLAIKPRLHIMDAIVAMEGNGPRSGDPKPLGLLLLSTDPVALDATLARLIALDPTHVPTITVGAEMGVGVFEEASVRVVGDDLEALRDPSFSVTRMPVLANASLAHYDWLKALTLPKLTIDVKRCTHCGLCVQACPVPGKAISFRNGRRDRPPVYNHRACIRCYCCHEMCPNRAIHKRTPLLGQLIESAGQVRLLGNSPVAGA